MKTYYNLDSQQARSLKTGNKMVIVVPLPKQPPLVIPKDSKISIQDNYFWIDGYFVNGKAHFHWGTPLHYPLNARVGLRETWTVSKDEEKRIYCYKSGEKSEEEKLLRKVFGCRWCSAQCMPREAIRHWGIVEDVRGDGVQSITENEASETGVDKMHLDDLGQTWETYKRGFQNWFNRHYKGKWTWEQNPYCEIFKVRKE